VGDVAFRLKIGEAKDLRLWAHCESP
jgi:hypothetical protein